MSSQKILAGIEEVERLIPEVVYIFTGLPKAEIRRDPILKVGCQTFPDVQINGFLGTLLRLSMQDRQNSILQLIQLEVLIVFAGS